MSMWKLTDAAAKRTEQRLRDGAAAESWAVPNIKDLEKAIRPESPGRMGQAVRDWLCWGLDCDAYGAKPIALDAAYRWYDLRGAVRDQARATWHVYDAVGERPWDPVD